MYLSILPFNVPCCPLPVLHMFVVSTVIFFSIFFVTTEFLLPEEFDETRHQLHATCNKRGLSVTDLFLPLARIQTTRSRLYWNIIAETCHDDPSVA